MDLCYPYTYKGRSFEQGELILFKTDNIEVDKIQVDYAAPTTDFHHAVEGECSEHVLQVII